jgi:predicted nucleotidyltransferase
MHRLIQEKRADIAALCRRHHVRHLAVFGSAARGEDFDPARSDADFLVEFAPDADPGAKDFLEMKEALKSVLGREVDLVERKAIEKSRNYVRRRHILGQAETVYVA